MNVYSEDVPGHGYVERAKAALEADQIDGATEEGRSLSVKEALEVSRAAEPAVKR